VKFPEPRFAIPAPFSPGVDNLFPMADSQHPQLSDDALLRNLRSRIQTISLDLGV
jgi:hypothetical protein